MDLPLELASHLGTLAQLTAVGILSYAAKVLREIRGDIRSINGRLIGLEAWRIVHDKQDDERHDDFTRRIGRLEDG